MQVWGARAPPVIIATDGRRDESAPSSVAFLLVDVVTGDKIAIAAVIKDVVINA